MIVEDRFLLPDAGPGSAGAWQPHNAALTEESVMTLLSPRLCPAAGASVGIVLRFKTQNPELRGWVRRLG